jgi:hypothetical protein
MRASVLTMAALTLATGCDHGRDPTPAPQAAQKPADDVQTITESWPDGSPRLSRQVVNLPDGTQVNQGIYRRWHANGEPEYEAVFVQGRKQGVETYWHENGTVRKRTEYADGQVHGANITWDATGAKRKEEHYHQGKPHGVWTEWDPAGRVKWQGRFDHGTPLP